MPSEVDFQEKSATGEMVQRSQVPLNLGIIAGSRAWDEYLHDRATGEAKRVRHEVAQNNLKLQKQLQAAEQAVVVAESALQAAGTQSIKNKSQRLAILKGLDVDVKSSMNTQAVNTLLASHAPTPSSLQQGAAIYLARMRVKVQLLRQELQESTRTAQPDPVQEDADPLATSVGWTAFEEAAEALNHISLGGSFPGISHFHFIFTTFTDH